METFDRRSRLTKVPLLVLATLAFGCGKDESIASPTERARGEQGTQKLSVPRSEPTRMPDVDGDIVSKYDRLQHDIELGRQAIEANNMALKAADEMIERSINLKR